VVNEVGMDGEVIVLKNTNYENPASQKKNIMNGENKVKGEKV